MRFWRHGLVCILALISSCGPAPESPSDTPSVAGETRREAPVAPENTADPAPSEISATTASDRDPSAPNGLELLDFGGSRFAILDAPEHAYVVDLDDASAFTVFGHPIRTGVAPATVASEVGFLEGGAPARVAVSTNHRMLVRTDAGVQAVDLAARGAMLAGFRGDVVGAEIASDGETFAVWSTTAVHVVRTSDGAHVDTPFAGSETPRVRFGEKSVVWSDGTSVHVVDRASLVASHTELTKPGASSIAVSPSKDGAIVVASRGPLSTSSGLSEPALVVVLRVGSARPLARVTSASVSNVIVDDEGTKVAWVEHSGEFDARAHVHTLSVTSGVHLRFESKAAHCQLGPEQLAGFQKGELVSDEECSPGCPSFERRPQMLAYDPESGVLLRRWAGDVSPPYNDTMSERFAEAGRVATRLGFAWTPGSFENGPPILRHGTAPIAIVERAGALVAADTATGKVIAKLDGSEAWPVGAARYWPGSPVRVIAVAGSGVAVWDASSGERIWTSRP